MTGLNSLKAALVLSVIGFLTGIARLILDVRFVPDFVDMMPEDQPGQVAVGMLIFIAVFGVWLWVLLAAARESRRGLIALLLVNLVLVFAWGFATATAFCPMPCPVASPLTDIVTWANMIVGLAASAVAGFALVKSRPVTQ